MTDSNRIPGEPVAIRYHFRHNSYYIEHDDGRTWGMIGPVFLTADDAKAFYWSSLAPQPWETN